MSRDKKIPALFMFPSRGLIFPPQISVMYSQKGLRMIFPLFGLVGVDELVSFLQSNFKEVALSRKYKCIMLRPHTLHTNKLNQHDSEEHVGDFLLII